MRSFKIKEAFRSIRNGANIKQDKSSGGIPVTRIETISESTIDLEKLGYAGITDDSFKNFYLQDGDILMSHINSVSHLGKVAVFENRSETIIHGMNLLCLKARTNILYPKYAYYFFRSPIFINSLKPITKKSVNQASFNISNFENIDILIPEKYTDQVRIATLLSQAEGLIKQRKESIYLLDEFLKSTFLKMFGDPFNNPMKWEVKKFGDVIDDIIYGTSTPPVYENEGIPFIRATNIKKGRISDKSMFFISESEAKKIEKCKLNVGDMIIVRSGANTGDAASIPIKYHGAYGAFDLIVKLNPISSLFYNELINSAYGKAVIKPLTQRAAQPHLNSEQVKNLNFYYPPFILQTKFAQIVEKIETLKTKYKTSLKELENLFASLSQKAFKGDLDLSKMEVFYEEQYSSTDNDRTELKLVDLEKVSVKVKPHQFYGGDGTIVAGERLAMQIKERYKDKHFSFEMLANFIKKEKAYDLDKYFSSEEIKANPKYDELEDLKIFLESAIVNVEMDVKQKEKLNPWLHLNQHFYNAKKENISIELTKEDFALIKNRTTEERSGIYFKIVPNEIN